MIYKMQETQHIERIRNYYFNSRFGYRHLLWGSQHFGFYPKNRNVSEKEAQVLMQDIIGEKLNLSNSMKVLDAGCGRGIVATYLANKFGCFVEGIDITQILIDDAAKRARKLNVNSVNFSVMDYSKMEFDDNCFDAIYAIESLCHSSDINKTLKELHRVLRKGGKVAFFDYTIANDDKFSDYEKEMLIKVINGTAANGLLGFRHNKFQNFLKEAGFKNIQAADITENVIPSVNRLRKCLFMPYLFVKALNQQDKYPNPTIAVEWHKFMKKGLWRYNIFTATK